MGFHFSQYEEYFVRAGDGEKVEMVYSYPHQPKPTIEGTVIGDAKMMVRFRGMV